MGDTFLISLYGQEKTQREVTIDPRGTISFLFVDSLNVIGKTISELREALETELKTYYRYVLLSITPIAFNSNLYTIVGEVIAPGQYFVQGEATVLSAICKAGGFTNWDFRDEIVDLADLEHSFLVREGQYLPIDFAKLVREGDLSQDVSLKSGDYIYIKNGAINQVFILGEVSAPTTLNYMKTITISEAIAESGGVTERASSRAVVIRGSLCCPINYSVDINRVFKGYAPDFMLCPGDIVYVPPRAFTTIRELIRLGIRSFVASVASDAGVEAFLEAHPHAKTVDGVSKPVSVIDVGVGL